MQFTPRYLVNNVTNIVANDAGFVTEYRPVYNRQLKVYKGIDNVLQFRLLNADQKPVTTSVYTPKFVAFDENNTLVLEHDGAIQQLDDSSATRGMFTVTITENDLLNVPSQYLKYNIYLVKNSDNTKSLTYVDSHFDNDATIFVDSYAFPGAKSSYSITQFTEDSGLAGEDDSTWLSESITAEPAINGNEALHTAAIYTDNYEGDVIVQATLANQITGTTQWADVATVSFDGSTQELRPVNFNGVYSYVRFKTTADPASKITKILVRN